MTSIGPGDLIESHHLESRPLAPLFVLGWALLFGFLLWREDTDAHPWIALGYGLLCAWFTFCAIWLHSRAPTRVAVHENGLNVIFGGGRPRFYPWSDVTGIEADTYDQRARAFVQTLSITLARGGPLIVNVRDSQKLIEQIAVRVLPPKA